MCVVRSDPNPNLDPDPNPMLSGQVESESEKNGSDPHHWFLGRLAYSTQHELFGGEGRQTGLLGCHHLDESASPGPGWDPSPPR